MAKSKGQKAWGAWVVWKHGEQGWAWERITKDSLVNEPGAIFADHRRGIMPLVRDWRSLSHVRSCVSKRVTLPTPEGE